MFYKITEKIVRVKYFGRATKSSPVGLAALSPVS